MAALNRQELYRLARLGAETRIHEIQTERAQLQRCFPDLHATAIAPVPEASEPVRRRRVMSADERRSVSIRMRRYWSARRKAEAANGKHARG